MKSEASVSAVHPCVPRCWRSSSSLSGGVKNRCSLTIDALSGAVWVVFFFFVIWKSCRRRDIWNSTHRHEMMLCLCLAPPFLQPQVSAQWADWQHNTVKQDFHSHVAASDAQTPPPPPPPTAPVRRPRTQTQNETPSVMSKCCDYSAAVAVSASDSVLT